MKSFLPLEFVLLKSYQYWILTCNILAQFKFIRYQLDLPKHLEHAWLITLSFQNTTAKHSQFKLISTSLLRCDREIKVLISASHGESIRFNLARWT